MPQRKTSTKDLSGIIVLDNFSYSTLFSREVQGENYPHRLILSPTFLFKHTDHSIITDMKDNAYPLLAHLSQSEISTGTTNEEIVNFITTSNRNDNREIYIVTSAGRVRALSLTGVARDFGQPFNTGSSTQTSLILYSGNIFFANQGSGNLYYISEASTGTTWSTITGLISPLHFQTFSIYLYVADKNSSSDAFRRKIKVYNTSFTQSGELDLGTNWDIQDIANNNHKFLVIVANPAGVFGNQYLFLWDGSWNNRPFHFLKLPGIYLGSVNYMGAFLLFLKVGKSVNVYELDGYALRFIDSFPSLLISENLLPPVRFSVYGNYIFWGTKINDLNENIIVWYNPLEKEILGINSNTANQVEGILANLDINQNLRIFYTDSTKDKVFSQILIPIGGLDNYISGGNSFRQTTSKLAYVSNVFNFVRAIKIDKIEAFYGNKPPNSDCGFDIKIESESIRTGETQSETFVIDNSKDDFYTIFSETGIRGEKITIKIFLRTNGTFKGNLKRLLIHYSYIN